MQMLYIALTLPHSPYLYLSLLCSSYLSFAFVFIKHYTTTIFSLYYSINILFCVHVAKRRTYTIYTNKTKINKQNVYMKYYSIYHIKRICLFIYFFFITFNFFTRIKLQVYGFKFCKNSLTQKFLYLDTVFRLTISKKYVFTIPSLESIRLFLTWSSRNYF